jgi:DNA-directed RNA polymerase subunit RPC12/RpoP
VIEFQCPNGHKIHCPEEQAGRAAKCPRCGVRFRIPDPSEVGGSAVAPGSSDVGRPDLTDSTVPPAAGPAAPRAAPAPPKEETIEFLCPNGHRLHGPASLQGRPGECPECGSRFRIPLYDEVSEGEETGEGIVAGRANGSLDSFVRRSEVDFGSAGTAEAKAAERGGAVSDHPLPDLIARLWAQKPADGAVELRLSNGDTLRPERFVTKLSQGTHAVFAIQEADGKYTLAAIAWESIQQILVRGLSNLPERLVE